MKNNLFDQAFLRAVRVLEIVSDTDLYRQTTIEKATMLEAIPPLGELATLRRRLAQQLQKSLTLGWITTHDMFEVFLVLSAVYRYDRTWVSGQQLSAAIGRLVASEVAVGGPYRCLDGQPGLGANAQIAVFMNMVAQPLPKVTAFLNDAIRTNKLDDPLLTRLGMQYVLMQAGLIAPKAEKALVSLCRQQRSDGMWDGQSLFRGQSGSCLVGTAIVIQTLAQFCHTSAGSATEQLQQKQGVVFKTAHQLFASDAPPLGPAANGMLERVHKADKNFEIALLPWFFARALKHPGSTTDEQCLLLGAANVCTWAAYTIYDDFLDNQPQPAHLPVANVAMRRALGCFSQVFTDPSARRYVINVFDAMDHANAWEVAHCRIDVSSTEVHIKKLPRYGTRMVLAKRSFAHALGPMLLLMQHQEVTKAHFRLVESAFRHYLIARQLNDDLHDWQEDLETGVTSYAVTAILRALRVQPGKHGMRILLPKMQHIFRQTVMQDIGEVILQHVAKSRQDFAASQLLTSDNNLYALVDAINQSVRQSLDIDAKGKALTAAEYKSL